MIKSRPEIFDCFGSFKPAFDFANIGYFFVFNARKQNFNCLEHLLRQF